MAVFSTTSNQVAALKELYDDPSEYMKDLVYKQNPLLALLPKDESIDGMGGKYLPVPVVFGNPQGRSHSFSVAQSNQTAPQDISFFVRRVKDYQLTTLENELIEATKTSAGAFIDQAKLNIDGGIRNATNNLAFELFNDGTATRGTTTSSSSQAGTTDSGTVLPLSNASFSVNFERGMVLRASATRGGAVSDDTVTVTKIDRANGIVYGTASDASLDSEWAIGTGVAYLSVDGDIPTAGVTTIESALGLCGLGAWIPDSEPGGSDNFWGVNRSVDSTRLAGLRYDGSSYTIEEGVTNALAFAAREGAKPDMLFMGYESYATLVNSLGAKVNYVQVQHDEVEVAFEGIRFQSAYGPVTVMLDRSCPPKHAYALQMDTWKLRTLGKAPKILFGLDGLEGLRVSNADAFEIRIGYYGNLICSAPGWNMVILLSA